jgi:hypothetical protein
VRVNDVTGMAQKGGPVFGHVQIAASAEALTTDKIPPGALDLLLAADLVVADMPEAALRAGPGTRVVANTDTAETGRFARDRAARVDADALLGRIRARCGRSTRCRRSGRRRPPRASRSAPGCCCSGTRSRTAWFRSRWIRCCRPSA